MMVTGTVRQPRAINSSYARSSSSTLWAVNGTPSCESNSFTCSQLRQALPEYTIIIAAIMRPLDGITILDLTRVLSGPYCTMLLADMGARVIKIEQPGKGDDTRAWGPPFLEGESAYFLSINRNKESVTLDFKHEEGRALLERLIAKSDVVVENFRPGTLTKLGLDYQTLAPRHPRLVFCSISGFGQTGPRTKEAGYDA